MNISKDTLLDYSVRNLNSIFTEIKIIGGNGSYGIAVGGDFEASLILSQNFWTKDNLKVDGDFVIAIPNRDLLFVTG